MTPLSERFAGIATTAMHEANEELSPANRASIPGMRHDISRSAMMEAQALTPTFIERWAVRRRLPHAHPVWTGVRLARWRGARAGSIVVLCGLAGALAPAIPPGTVLVPDWVGRPAGTILRCDAEVTRELREAATALGFKPETGPLLTSPTLVTGPEREKWARHGYVAADMETGLLAGQGLRVATVRVILDGPRNPISAQWLAPRMALLRPAMWRELWWLCWTAPAYSLRAAEVLAAATQRGASDQTAASEGDHVKEDAGGRYG